MRRQLLRNSAANFLGGALPALVTVITVPLVVHSLGEAQYGLLSLVLAVVGYFAIIDVNITAGSVKYLAEYHATGDAGRVRQVVVLGLAFYLVVGLLGGLGVFFSAHWLVGSIFKIAPGLVDMAEDTLRLAGLSFFVAQIQLYLQSIPQSVGRYDISGRYEALFGVLLPIITAAVAVSGGDLFLVVLCRLIASVVNVGLLIIVVKRLLPELGWAKPSRQIIGRLLSFSGFAYLKRLASIAYEQADKLIIGAIIGAEAVTWYVVPFMLVSRVFSLVNRLGSVMFPAASAMAARGELADLGRIYITAVRYTVFLNGTLWALLAIFAHFLLAVWMGPSFAERSSLILALLATAVFVDSLTNLPSQVNDGLGHPRVTGGFAIVRAIVGTALSYAAIGRFGVVGAAAAQLTMSVVMAALFLVSVHGRTVPVSLKEALRGAYGPSLLWVAGLAGAGWLMTVQIGGGWKGSLFVSASMGVAALVVGYTVILREGGRQAVGEWMTRKRLP